jgi:NAD(P)-dependent dehydrogenase (short-subunit alcohol dehydrogenase family)
VNESSQPLSQKHALVTGGARGIGSAITQALLANGARVTMLGRDEAILKRAAEGLKKQGEVAYVVADVSDPAAVAPAFEQARQRFGRIDVLINNAGQASSAPFHKTDLNLWRQHMAVNLDGVYLCTHAALPGMLEAGWGRVVNIASTAGLEGYAYVTAYCASKHGVIGLTRALAQEVATKNITVNAVCPGYTDTDMVQQAVGYIVTKTGRTAEQAREELATHNPQKRLITPQEVANAVLWLVLPGSEAITGQSIAVAGGAVT